MMDLLKLKYLEGHRTQVAAVVIALLTFALNVGWVDEKTYTAVVGFLTSIGLITASVHRPKP